jgi:hypothetical protein
VILAEIIPRPVVFARTLVIIAVLEGLSFLGYLVPAWNHGIFLVATLLAFALAFIRFESLVALVFLELAISPKGYLFSWAVSGQVISLRHMLFAAAILGWCLTIVRTKRVPFFKSPLIWSTLLLSLVFVIGTLVGWQQQPHNLVIADANGYAALLLIPLAYGVLSNRKRFYQTLRLVLQGVVAQGIVALIIAGVFSGVFYSSSLVRATAVDEAQLARLQSLAGAPENAELAQTTTLAPEKLRFRPDENQQSKPLLYRWLRDTGQAEVTYLGGRVFRVFSANMWFAVPLLFFLVAAAAREQHRRQLRIGLVWIAFLGIMIVASYSRSFWLASAVGMIMLMLSSPRLAVRRMLLGVFGFILILTVLGMAIPPIRTVAIQRLSSTLHPTNDVATLDRVNLLNAIEARLTEHPWRGSGFGSNITYPIVVPNTTFVEYIRVYLFEWTYLDLTVKLGLFGVSVVLLFLGHIGLTFASAIKRLGKHDALPSAALAAWAAFLALNITTPYLNHPLGFGTLALLVGAAGVIIRQRTPWRA